MGSSFITGAWFWAVAWQSTVLLGGGLMLSRLLRGRVAQAHFIVFLCMAAILILPVANAVARQRGWGMLPAATTGDRVAESAPAPMDSGVTDGAEVSVPPQGGTPEPFRASSIALVWAAVAGLLLLRVCVGLVAGLKLLARARPVVNEKLQALLETSLGRMGIARTPVTFSTKDVRCPGIWCWAIHPALLLPEAMAQGARRPADPDWIGIFCHELSHLKRRDHLPAIVAEIACCVFWWQPLAWLCRGALHRLADEACDGMVVSSGQPAADYANLLVNMVAQPRSLTALSMVSGKGSLRRRLDLILKSPMIRADLGRGWASAATVLTFMAIACMAALQPGANAQTKTGKDPSTVQNAGFEAGKADPEGWKRGAAVPGVEYIWDRKVAHAGKASLCLKKTENRYFPIAQWTQSIPIEKIGGAKQLKLSGWVRAENACKAILDVSFVDADGKWRHQWAAYIGAKKSNDPPANHDWTKYEGVVNVPEGTKEVTVGLQIYGPGTVWFDDVELKTAE
ncbi:MAG: M56 family metallopeptidase [Candidatus Sumerlaeia bacterium]